MLTKPEIESLIRELLAANRSPAPGIVVLDVANNPPSIDVEVRFLASHTYCCAEPGCHLPGDLSRLPLLAGFTIRWHCIVEEGAQLKCLATFGLSLSSNGYPAALFFFGRVGKSGDVGLSYLMDCIRIQCLHYEATANSMTTH